MDGPWKTNHTNPKKLFQQVLLELYFYNTQFMAGLVPILRFKQIQFIGNGGGNFHYLSKGISFFACTFQPDGNFIGQCRFYIQVDVSQTLIRISAPYQFFACIYLQRITAHTPSGQFHADFIHPCGTFQLIGNPCGSCFPVIPPFAQFIIIETVDCTLIIGSGNGGNDTDIHFETLYEGVCGVSPRVSLPSSSSPGI